MKANDSLKDVNFNQILIKNERIVNTTETKSNNNITEKINIAKSFEINRKNYILKFPKKNKKEEKNQIKIYFSVIDRLFCLYSIELCRKRINRYSYYNLFYKGKDYIIKVLDITNYLKFNHFLHMFFIINEKEKKQLYDYVTTPILSSNYVGPRFEADKEK